MKSKITFFVIVLAALTLSACTAAQAAAIETGIAATLQISELQTAAAGGGQSEATDTPEPTQTEASGEQGTATNSATPTSSIPYVSVSVDTNCRTGPRVDYGLVT